MRDLEERIVDMKPKPEPPPEDEPAPVGDFLEGV
jgi:hypothetical protein